MWFDPNAFLAGLPKVEGTPANSANPANPVRRNPPISGISGNSGAGLATNGAPANRKAAASPSKPDLLQAGIKADVKGTSHGSFITGQPKMVTGKTAPPADWVGLPADHGALIDLLRDRGPLTYGAARAALGWGATRAWRADAHLKAAELVDYDHLGRAVATVGISAGAPVAAAFGVGPSAPKTRP